VRAKRQEPELLRRGKAFHRKDQASWHEEAEGDVFSEKGVSKPSGRKGRIDVFVEAGETKALVEIKATDWDRMTEAAVRRNIRRQARQVWSYIDGQPNDADGVCPGIVFPKRPRDKVRMNFIEEMFLDEGIPVVWEDETVEERKLRGNREGHG
jgi:hypothetical protein